MVLARETKIETGSTLQIKKKNLSLKKNSMLWFLTTVPT